MFSISFFFSLFFFFFFQAEDGIRDRTVTGVQTCALPILVWVGTENRHHILGHLGLLGGKGPVFPMSGDGPPEGYIGTPLRSEERRVGKECRSRGWPKH